MSLIKKPLRLRIILNLIQKEGIKMKKGLIELVFILDRSGSMRGLEADTVGGFNSLIEKQKQTPGEALVSLVLFDDQFEVVHHRRKIESLEALTKGTYYVRGSTALVDAVGRGIEKIKHVHEQLGKDNIPEKTMFVITTDGQENASKQFDTHRLKRLISEQQEKNGWEFLFLGANIDSFTTATDLGIQRNRAANFEASEEGVKLKFMAVNETISRFRDDDVMFMESLKEHLPEDPKKKKK
jgi:uncharacterized protein YegL